MTPPATTFFEELAAAGRAFVALVIGNRQAASFLDFSQRGLVGSFIAFLLANAVNAYAPLVLGAVPPAGVITQALLLVGALYVLQLAIAGGVLRILGRMDGFVPYVVAYNWSRFFITLLSLVLVLLALPADVATIIVGILVIVIEINIARLIVTLPPLQIALFLLAQLFGVGLVSLVLFGGNLQAALQGV